MTKFFKNVLLILMFSLVLILGGCGDKKTSIKDSYDCTPLNEAIEIAKKAGETETEDSYYLYGKIQEVVNPTFGQMIISDGTNSISIYGTTDEKGIKYSDLEDKPYAGDEVVLYGKLHTFKDKPEMKSGIIKAFTHIKQEVDVDKYKELSIKDARKLESNINVKVEGYVSKITYADKFIPNGFFLIDDNSSIYIHGKNAAQMVKVGNKVTVCGLRSNYINPKEINFANKFKYPGSVQISDAFIYENDNKINELNFDIFKRTTVKDLISDLNFNAVTSQIYKVTATIKKVPGSGFVNYYINDLDGKTGSYVYSSNSGADFEYLDEFDGKICNIYLSVINCKCTESAIIRRFVPIKVESIDMNFPETDIPKFVFDYYIAESVTSNINVGSEYELINQFTNEFIDLSKVKVEYSSLTPDTVSVVGNKLTTLNIGYGKIKVKVSCNGIEYLNNIIFNVIENVTTDTKIKDVVNSQDNTKVTVKGVVLSSLVNRTGFYLIDETGIIAVTTDTETLKTINIGNEIVVEGNRIHKKKAETGDHIIGQTVIADAVVLTNDLGNHEYSDSFFDKTKTIADLNKFDVKDDYSYKAYTVKAKIQVIESAYFTSMKIADPTNSEITIDLYCSSAKQYAFLNEFANKEVTLELALCNWNDKGHYKACVISVNDGTKKVMNTLNFQNN